MGSEQHLALDTNVAILLARGHWQIAQVLINYDKLLLPAPVAGELLFGAHNSGQPQVKLARERSFMAGFGLLAAGAEAAEHYAEIRHDLKRKGQPIPENDMWIAAICRANKVPLFTLDQHFSQVAGLQLLAA